MHDQGECRGDVWLSDKSAGADQDYHRVSYTHIPVLDQDDGAFDWFASYATGSGFQMQAPGQVRSVVALPGLAVFARARFGRRARTASRPCARHTTRPPTPPPSPTSERARLRRQRGVRAAGG